MYILRCVYVLLCCSSYWTQLQLKHFIAKPCVNIYYINIKKLRKYRVKRYTHKRISVETCLL